MDRRAILPGFVEDALACLRARGFASAPLLAAAGLPDPPRGPVTSEEYGRLWRVMAEVAEDEFFGLAARPMRPGSFALMCHAVLHARTLERALRRALRFLDVVLDDPRGALQGAPGSHCWLIEPDEGLGCSVRLARGGGGAETAAVLRERVAIVPQGKVVLTTEAGDHAGSASDLLFLPAGTAGAFEGPEGAAWIEVEALEPAGGEAGPSEHGPRAVPIDPHAFIGAGFGYQAQLGRARGARSIRANAVQVSPGSGSPDWHIHPFAQFYLIREGEMTVEVGRSD